jgi:uncharacterized protein YndB with AHSA1/START domain
MPRDKDRKRIIRARMKKTGESYTAARAQIISKTQPRPTRTVDHAALAGMSDAAVAAKTGRSWPEWVRLLDADNAAALPHREIAALVHEKHGVGSWWTQMVTVGYERLKRLRDRGQQRSGAYEVSKSKTIDVPVGVLFDACADQASRRRWLGSTDLKVRTATAPKSMRLSGTDGTSVVLAFTAKGRTKSSVAVQITKLPDKAAADRARKVWSEHLGALASHLKSTPSKEPASP